MSSWFGCTFMKDVCCHDSFSLASFTDLNAIKPVIPALAEVSPYVFSGICTGAMIAAGFWAAKKIRAVEQISEPNPLVELQLNEEVANPNQDPPTETTKLLG